jgi:protein tyrosine phosphatase (PTP) superfamily phosphohydrolase (DUF442 family)
MADNTATQRDPDVVSYEAFSGVRNDVDPERFGRADLAIGENVVLDKTGRVSRRGGRTQLNAAATHSLWSDREQLAFCVQGTSLKRIGTDYSLTTLRTVTANAYMHYVKVNDEVYFSNGIDTGVFDNGATRTWGLTVPPLPVVAVGVGNMPAGRYQFVSTYVRADGQESGARMAGQITVPDNSSLIFTLVAPTGLRTVIYHNVYITTPNGELLYLALTVPVASTTAVYANDTTELTYDLKTQFLGPPPAGQLVGYYSGRMLVAVEDRIHYSEPLAYELFDLRRYIPLNGRVTLVAQMEDKETLDQPGQNSGLFLGTDRSCGILIGSDPDSFQYVPKTDYGAIEGALDFIDGTIFADGSTGARRLPIWLTTEGVCIGMPGMEIRNLTRSRYSFAANGRGAGLFDTRPNRFIAVSNF